MLPRVLTEGEIAAMPTSQLIRWITVLSEPQPWDPEHRYQINQANLIQCQNEIDQRLPAREPVPATTPVKHDPRARVTIPRPPDPPGSPPRIIGREWAPVDD